MQYYSLNKQSPNIDFRQATINGQAPDKGLYFPEYIPKVSEYVIKNIEQLSNEAIAYQVIQPYIGNCIDEASLQRIVNETINFSIPLVPITAQIFSLELFHGPTLAFKDVGARFMSRCLSYFLQNVQQQVTVLVATSGDTGGAVANGFYNVLGVNVVILYPSGKVSSVQEKQLTTLGNNITALEVMGTFDDCQAMVKAAFNDADVIAKLFLTSANSINVARWLPQQFYYFMAYKQWAYKDKPPVVAVPSGNFGNICAGLLAKVSGLPLGHFIAACNANAVVPNYMATSTYTPQQAVATISNAMDVGNPSNFVRILELFHQEYSTVTQQLSSTSTSDALTKETLLQVYNSYNYLCDTHGAVAYSALEQYLQHHPEQKGILLETAHPIKFYDVVEPIINTTIPIPTEISVVLQKEKKSIIIGNSYENLKAYLLS